MASGWVSGSAVAWKPLMTHEWAPRQTSRPAGRPVRRTARAARLQGRVAGRIDADAIAPEAELMERAAPSRTVRCPHRRCAPRSFASARRAFWSRAEWIRALGHDVHHRLHRAGDAPLLCRLAAEVAPSRRGRRCIRTPHRHGVGAVPGPMAEVGPTPAPTASARAPTRRPPAPGPSASDPAEPFFGGSDAAWSSAATDPAADRGVVSRRPWRARWRSRASSDRPSGEKSVAPSALTSASPSPAAGSSRYRRTARSRGCRG